MSFKSAVKRRKDEIALTNTIDGFPACAERRYKVNASRSSSVHSNADSCTLDATFVVDVIAAFEDDSSGLLSFFFFVTESLTSQSLTRP